MSFKDYRKESRASWGADQNCNLTIEQINCGALLRIADATELMCKDREKLERDYAYMRAERDRYRSAMESAERRIAALKGVITKAKRERTK